MEENLVRRAIDRDPGAIEALYDRHASVLLGVCMRYCGNRDDAGDILHDAFIKIIQKIHTFRMRDEGSLEAWMRRIVVNTALNFIRSRNRDRMFTDLEPVLFSASLTAVEGPEEEAFPIDADRETIMAMICSLPAGYRTVFNLYVFEEYGHREIAEALGCTENTSKSQLSKARAMLRKKLTELNQSKNRTTYAKVEASDR